MYRCDSCGRVVPPNHPADKVVTETRDREHGQRATPKSHSARGSSTRRRRADPGGSGRGIVREQLLCPERAQDAAYDAR